MERQALIDAIQSLPDGEFEHLAHVCHDIARRLPASAGFALVGRASRLALGIPEPAAVETITAADVGQLPADVTVGLSGVEGTSEVGGL